MILFFNSSISSSSCLTLWSLASRFFHFDFAFGFFIFPRDEESFLTGMSISSLFISEWKTAAIYVVDFKTANTLVRSKKESIETDQGRSGVKIWRSWWSLQQKSQNRLLHEFLLTTFLKPLTWPENKNSAFLWLPLTSGPFI